MNVDEYLQYFEGLAINHKQIAHDPQSNKAFFSTTIEQIADSLRSIKGLVLYVPVYDVSYVVHNGESMFESLECSFMVLNRAKSTDYSNQREVLDQTKQIAQDIISKMMFDRNEKLYGLIPDSFTLTNQGPMFDSLYGWVCTFSIDIAFDYTIKADRWIES